ncbi:feruloyl-CoA synthase [Sulfitobacter sp. SK011]|uniref:feruloyl-CoA synthase n=1 Tax=Sulfitobacter sp. SK011 TaxID=1389004 RepID=UPI000E0AF5B9|nr:feruloyl-CoA synthase [Sulfitobacter sp. SK011]AXI43757.1 feruloyl-CoA synthetase [Sulfitobacter sp. SK011]
MTAHLNLKPHNVLREDRADGTILLRSAYAMGPVARCSGDWLHYWATTAPDRVFLAERSGKGWREVRYAEALAQVQAIAGHLISRDLGPDRPIMILSGNGIDHGLLTLAAQYVGISTVPVAEQYSLIPAAHPRLEYAARLVRPGMVFAEDAAQYAGALALNVFDGVEVLSSAPGDNGATDFAQFLRPISADIASAFQAITSDTLAKILLTSGSTSDPKGVLTTMGMMTANQAQIAACLPFVQTRPPCIVDWLPWNHVFGGSHNFNLMLANGGSLYIDAGKPAPGLFDLTLENLGQKSATISFNVPVGFAQLVTALERDKALRDTYFADLDMIFYAGASLPQDTWAALERLALDTCGQLPLITTSWGLTETAPAALINHADAKGAGIVGVPMPGVTLKLVPDAQGRCEVRVKGANVTPGYLHDAARTQKAFDDEGFFRTGDAMRFVDADDVNKGLHFDGRLDEDFKLATGTWVQAANLRLALLAVLAPFAQDVVITGQGRAALGALIVPNRAAIAAQGWDAAETAGVMHCDALNAELAERLTTLAAKATGSATRITCALILADPPSMADGEATAKGNINFAKLLERRADLIEMLYDPTTPARISVLVQAAL